MKSLTQVKKLPESFISKGETFERIYDDETSYVYKRIHSGIEYFEAFRKKNIRCVDLYTKVATGEWKEKYPKDKDFGKWAWCCKGLEEALNYTINIIA